jgi:biotin carboxyl carrier protein
MVRVEDRQYKIGITKAISDGHYVVEVDGKSYDAEFEGAGTGNEKPFQFKLGGRVYTTQISNTGRGAPLAVIIENASLKAEVRTELPFRAVKSMEIPLSSPVTKKGPVGKIAIEGAVTAPMTGKIVSVKVKKGDSVKAGEILCVLEAMKMENEILATRTGTVQEVSVSEGSNVNEGDTLIILE